MHTAVFPAVPATIPGVIFFSCCHSCFSQMFFQLFLYCSHSCSFSFFQQLFRQSSSKTQFSGNSDSCSPSSSCSCSTDVSPAVPSAAFTAATPAVLPAVLQLFLHLPHWPVLHCTLQSRARSGSMHTGIMWRMRSQAHLDRVAQRGFLGKTSFFSKSILTYPWGERTQKLRAFTCNLTALTSPPPCWKKLFM